jgi:hypothetical protein
MGYARMSEIFLRARGKVIFNAETQIQRSIQAPFHTSFGSYNK